jgi:hypothetical protein
LRQVKAENEYLRLCRKLEKEIEKAGNDVERIRKLIAEHMAEIDKMAQRSDHSTDD